MSQNPGGERGKQSIFLVRPYPSFSDANMIFNYAEHSGTKISKRLPPVHQFVACNF